MSALDPIRDDARAASLAWLRARVKPGDVILTAVLHRSRSGLESVVGCWALNIPEREALKLTWRHWHGDAVTSADAVRAADEALGNAPANPRTLALFGHVARVLGRKADTKRGGVVMRGGDAAAKLIRDFGVALYGAANALTCEEL